MNHVYPTDIIREYFRKNNFYAHHLKTPSIAKNLLSQYVEVAKPSNKRNLRLDKYWSEIYSFGRPREIIAIDLGGTNLNLFKIQVKGEKEIIVADHASSAFYEEKTYTPDLLFSDLREEIDKFIPSSKERGNLRSIVFIFSYPIEQLVREDGYVDAVCTYFGKTRKSKGIVGLQVGIMFQSYLRENGYPNVSVSVTNDTPIYSLAAKGHEIMYNTSFDAAMNVIVGTGMNISAAYDERDLKGSEGLRIINTECGDFKGVQLSTFDTIFNEKNDTPGRYLTEKMISGAWQHQMFKIILEEVIKNGIAPKETVENMKYQDLQAEQIEQLLKSDRLSKEQSRIIGFIWKEINKRGASVCAIILAAIMSELYRTTKKEHLSIIVMETGSVLSKGLGFREALLDMLDIEIGRHGLGEKISYNFYNHKDQSALGAAIFDAFFTK